MAQNRGTAAGTLWIWRRMTKGRDDMGLADAAREAKREAASPELLWLREMRKFVNTHTDEMIDKMWADIGAFDEKAESWTEDGRKKLCVMIAQVQEITEMRKFYRDVLKCAETAERKEKGGGEKGVKEYRQDLEKIERSIRKKYEQERKWQLELDLQTVDKGE